jgi:hypothetical protein
MKRTCIGSIYASSGPAPRRPVNKPVFQVYPPRGWIPNSRDVGEALDLCKKMTEQQSRDYLYSMGIDYDNARVYIHIVGYMERCYRKSKSDGVNIDINMQF